MLWVVTFSMFLPSFTSSSVVCANPSAAPKPSSIPHSQIFFMIASTWLKFNSFSHRHAPAQLFEEIQQHSHVNRAFLLRGCIRSGKHRKALAVRREIQVPYPGGFADLGVRPEPRFVGGERIGFPGIAGGHDTVVRSFVEQFPAVTRPDRVSAAGSRDLPLAGPGVPAWKRSHIHLVSSRFV